MKRFFIFIAAACVAAASMADDGIKWLSMVHDFGAFSEDDKIAAYFKFVNETGHEVAISQVAATCGCTTPHYTTDPIAPGDTATIEVVYNPIGRPGRFEKQVYVRTTADYERYKLTIKGVVIGNAESIKTRYPVEMGPLKLRNGAAMMGRISAGKAKMEYIDGYNQSHNTIEPQFADVPPYLQVSAVPEKVGPGDLVSLNFYFRGDKCKEWGIITDSIKIAPYPGAEYYQLPVVAIIEEDFTKLTPEQLRDAPSLFIDTDRVDLGAVPISSTKAVTAKLELTNRGTDPLVIRRVYSQDPAVKASVSQSTIKKGKTATLKITFDPSSQPTGIINTRLTIITNDPDNPTRSIRVVATRI